MSSEHISAACRRTSGVRRTLLSVFLVFLAFGCSARVADEELFRRASAAHPAWQSYEEDIKAQMGAQSAAEWSGLLVRVDCDAATIRAAFRLEGPWASRACAFPILMREPGGSVARNGDARRENGLLTYAFERSKSEAPAWLEFRFPHGERRIVLDAQGHWEAGV